MLKWWKTEKTPLKMVFYKTSKFMFGLVEEEDVVSYYLDPWLTYEDRGVVGGLRRADKNLYISNVVGEFS